jgi:hypothetical protein
MVFPFAVLVPLASHPGGIAIRTRAAQYPG